MSTAKAEPQGRARIRVMLLLVIHKPASAFPASNPLAAFAKDHAPQVARQNLGGFPVLILNSNGV